MDFFVSSHNPHSKTTLTTHPFNFNAAMSVDSQNPYRMAEMALELQIERLRVAEITNARDAALHRLFDAYAHITEKNALIEKFQAERDGADGGAAPGLLKSESESDPQAAAVDVDALNAHIRTLKSTTEELRAEIAELNSKLTECPLPAPPPPTPVSPASPSSSSSKPSYTENSRTKVTGLLREFFVWRLNSFIQPAGRVEVSTETEFPTKVDAGVATEVEVGIEQAVCLYLCLQSFACIEIQLTFFNI